MVDPATTNGAANGDAPPPTNATPGAAGGTQRDAHATAQPAGLGAVLSRANAAAAAAAAANAEPATLGSAADPRATVQLTVDAALAQRLEQHPGGLPALLEAMTAAPSQPSSSSAASAADAADGDPNPARLKRPDFF